MTTLVGYLDQRLRAAGLPIQGVSVGDQNDRTTWSVQFAAGATAADMATAASLLASFDPTTIPALDAEADASAATNQKAVRALVAYIWKVTHGGVNPTGPQLVGELATLKGIYKALP